LKSFDLNHFNTAHAHTAILQYSPRLNYKNKWGTFPL